MAEPIPHDPNYGLAFAVSIGAGLSTAIGAASVKFGSLSNPKFLSVGMALAAGVMILVSLLDLIPEAVESFEAAWPEDQYPNGKRTAYALAMAMFFVGAILTVVMEVGVHKIQHALGGKDVDHHDLPKPVTSGAGDEVVGTGEKGAAAATISTAERAELMKTAMITGLAITIHNLPEGLASFISMSHSVASGLPLAVAIAIHNIPEGLCVAVPVFYATGSRWKAFIWGTLTGASEPLGAVLGYVILKATPDTELSVVYGVLFAIIAGVMTFVSISQLIPTALAHHPNPRDVAILVFVGMAVMASSLVLFEVAGA
ncbi:hypothetical protein H9P43_000368 [Blastocladiella emersonii ATCC 22665]|nr:hypothetical protein H9P43_000368 [Blastocladiella emersonii ATCC 22665]